MFDVYVILGFAAVDLYTVQKEVIEILKGRILVGHALHNDLKVRRLWHINILYFLRLESLSYTEMLVQVLMLSHPKKSIRDTHSYGPYCK